MNSSNIMNFIINSALRSSDIQQFNHEKLVTESHINVHLLIRLTGWTCASQAHKVRGSVMFIMFACPYSEAIRHL